MIRNGGPVVRFMFRCFIVFLFQWFNQQWNLTYNFPYCAKELGNLSEELRNIGSIKMFKISILNFARPRENSVFAVHDINGLKLLTLMIQSIQCVCAVKNPKQLCTTSCATIFIPYIDQNLNDICTLNHSLQDVLEENLFKVLLYGAEEFSFKISSEILSCLIKFIKKTDLFSGPLFLS